MVAVLWSKAMQPPHNRWSAGDVPRRRLGAGSLLRGLLLAVCAATALQCSSSEEPSGAPPLPDYPAIGDQEMGHLRWVLALANQPLEDFTDFEAMNQENLTAYRYQIAFSAYFLALEQYHKLPAWSEVLQPAMDRLIRKLLLKPVWQYWAKTSRGVPTLEPDMSRPYPESHDPVGEKNIMYSGHLGHLINLYEMLYHDFRWDEPGSMVFAWNENEKYVYDNQSLERVMHDQMKNNAYHAISCEPNAVFPECNQHPVLSFLLYDGTHGTNLFEAGSLFLDFFVRNQMTDPTTHETAMLHLVKQDWTLSQSNPYYGNLLDLIVPCAVRTGLATLESATADGWTGSFMHAWQPGFVEERYPYWKQHHLIKHEDGTVELRMESWEPRVRYGFFATLAAEMGDLATRDQLLAYADAHYGPIWQEGTYHYPNDLAKGCTNLTDRLLALARANAKDGLRALHSRPFAASHFGEPRLAEVDFPAVLVRRAVYDAGRGALIVTTAPGGEPGGTTSFSVAQLDPTCTYRLSLDGTVTERYRGVSTLSMTVGLDVPHTLVLQAE
jgi:hypothetical protein